MSLILSDWAAIRPRSMVRGCALLLALPLVASCDDHHWCGNCYPSGPPSEVSQGLAAGNFNGNGHTSVIETGTVLYYRQGNPGSLKVYPSTGAGSFGTPTLTPDGDDPLYLASADLVGNGLLDVVSASFDDGTLTVFLNNTHAPGTFGAPVILSSPGASQVAIGDMNKDGLQDLVSADFKVSLFIQTSPGTFANPVSLYSGGANWVAVGDLNGDGIPDIVIGGTAEVDVLLQNASVPGTFLAAASYPVISATQIAVADVNGDGLVDIVVPVGVSHPLINGVYSNSPGVLLQVAGKPGTFSAQQDLP